MALKAAILVGGPQKGTRFRPLSLQIPKPLFPIAGVPLIEHHIDQLSKLDNLVEIFLIGFYLSEQFSAFVERCSEQYSIKVRYLEEPEAYGTAGGLHHFRLQILDGNPEGVFVLNGDVCGDLPVSEMVFAFGMTSTADCIILTTETTRENSVLHYVDKPTTFVSQQISCGVYLLRIGVIDEIGKYSKDCDAQQVWFETVIFPRMAADSKLYSLCTDRWWSQVKTPAAVLNANANYLRLYRESNPSKLCHHGADIIGNVHPTACLGPNVSIGAKVRVGSGVRIRESIVLGNVILEDHCCIIHSVIGWRSVVGEWARIEGTPIPLNLNKQFAKLGMFSGDASTNFSLAILSSDVQVSPEIIVLNATVLPYKKLSMSYKNQIIF